MSTIEIPDYVVDWLGNKVYPGDTILYATVSGSSAYMKLAIVLEFYVSGGYSSMLKMKVQRLQEQGWQGTGKPSNLNVGRGASFTRVPHAFSTWEFM